MNLRALSLLGSLTIVTTFLQARPAEEKTPVAQDSDITATFSIVAVDPETGVCGAAVASKYPAVGKVVPYVRAGVGAFCTQHHHNPAWGEPALDMLEAGKRPDEVIAELLKNDSQPEMRQLGLIDLSGRAAVHNPTQAPSRSRYWAAMTGRFYCCQGNTLAGREVIVAMAKAYEETQGSLADRLMAAMIAGDCAGGGSPRSFGGRDSHRKTRRKRRLVRSLRRQERRCRHRIGAQIRCYRTRGKRSVARRSAPLSTPLHQSHRIAAARSVICQFSPPEAVD